MEEIRKESSCFAFDVFAVKWVNKLIDLWAGKQNGHKFLLWSISLITLLPISISYSQVAPIPRRLSIEKGARITENRNVTLSIEAENANEMFLFGDLVDEEKTFEWIPFSASIQVTLAQPDGTRLVQVRFRNEDGIESSTLTASIILDQVGPVIQRIDIFDVADSLDRDGIFHAGENLRIAVTVVENKRDLDGTVQIVSASAGLDFGKHPLTFVSNEYRFLWVTDGFPEGEYTVSVHLEDELGRFDEVESLIVLDNTPPVSGALRINDDAAYTASRVVSLTLSFPLDAVSLFLDGDIADGPLTRQWVSVRERLPAILTESNGKKEITSRFRDAADNESPVASSTITLSQSPPNIISISTFDRGQPQDTDEIYRTGQQVVIEVLVANELEGLDSQLRITSEKASYNPSQQVLTDEGAGVYRYVWNTTGLPDANDYQVTLRLDDTIGHVSEDNSLVLTIDNIPPQNIRLSVVGGVESRTASRRIALSILADGASEMRITGDVDQRVTPFDWVAYASDVTVELLPGDGEKRIEVTLRDRAGNVSNTESLSVFLDTIGPQQLRITPEIELTNQTKLDIRIAAEEAEQMFLQGDIEPSDVTFQFIPFSEEIEVELTPEDGQKTIVVRFRDAVENESETQTEVVLDRTPPEIREVRSQNVADAADTDGRYRPGSVIEIIAEGSEAGLEGSVTIDSEAVGYNSGVQSLLDAGGGTYTFVWASRDLPPAQYGVSVELVDAAGNRVRKDDHLLTLTEDTILNQALLNDGAPFTDTRQVSLQIVAPDASEMFIDGDIEDTDVTRRFLPLTSPIELLLSRGDGQKSVRVQLRKNTGVIDLGTISTSIILDEIPPVITRVQALLTLSQQDEGQNRFRAGEQVALVITAASIPPSTGRGETELKATIHVRSQSTGYDSGEQTAQDNGDGTYTFLWDTVGLGESDDYQVEATLTDSVGHIALDDSTVVQIDNTPPQNPSFEINVLVPEASIAVDGQPTRVKGRSISLTWVAEEATEMFITGDVVSDSNTRVWFPIGVRQSIIVNLTPGDALKTIRVRFRDVARNETEFVPETVILDAFPPVITSVVINSLLLPRPLFLRAGQTVQIEVQTEPEAEVFVRVQSSRQGYDTNEQTATPIEGRDGGFQYFWETQGLNDSDDYIVTTIARDLFGRDTEQNAKVVLDTVPPENPTIRIERGQAFTVDDDVRLELSAVGATEMFIDGDVADDGRIFRWIAFQERAQVKLAPGNGEKEIVVLYRDEAGNETSPVSDTIVLDTIGPDSISVKIAGEMRAVTNSRDITLELKAERAVEMFVDGDIVRGANTHRWIALMPTLPVRLTDQDGSKRVGARFRSGEDNESARVEISITLDRQPPEIREVRSSDVSDPSDNDDIYQPGQQIRLSIQSEVGVTCNLRITGPGAYDSGTQEIQDAGSGVYQFAWMTDNVKPGRYAVKWECTDNANNQASSGVEIVLDDTVPTGGSVEIIDERVLEEEKDFVESPSITLRLQARDAAEMFVSGDVVNDTHTFQWIPFKENLLVNLTGQDGAKTIFARFRSPARVESQETKVSVVLETARPRLVSPINLFESTDRTGGVVILGFDEEIREIVPEKFQIIFRNPFRTGSEIGFDVSSVRSSVSFGKIELNLSEAQMKSILALQGSDPTISVVVVSLAEDSVLDNVEKGNLPANTIPMAIRRLANLQAVADNAFSPNGDGIQENTRITYTLPADGFVIINIVDTVGVSLVTLRNELQLSGTAHEVTWDGRDASGNLVSEGLYRLKLSVFDTGVGLPIGLRSWDVILDNHPPTVVEVEPKDGQTILGTLQFRLTAEDGGTIPSDIAGAFLLLGEQQIPLVPVVSPPGTPPTEAKIFETPLNLPGGENSLTAVVRDAAGNETQVELTYFVSSSALLTFINYPNPVVSGQGMHLRYSLRQPAIEGRIRVFDAAGDLVFFKALEQNQLGVRQMHLIEWDGQDLFGNPLARGVYFAILEVEDSNDTRKVNHKIAIR